MTVLRLGPAIPVLCVALAACATPSPRFLGTEPYLTEVRGREMRVYAVPYDPAKRQIEAQVIIVDGVWGETAAALAQDAAEAIGQAAQGTPCRLDRRTLKGETTVWTGRLRCTD
ncbi:MAG: hypothetical protein ACFBRM_01150 [Pikeienuella sp.]